MKALQHAARRLITTSTAPILTACVLSCAALAAGDALTSPAAAVPALIVQFTTTNEGVSMSKTSVEKVGQRAGSTTTDGNAKPARAAGGALFIHGPQGCGKSRNAEALCKAFGKKRAVDFGDDPALTQQDYASNLIVFSHIPLPGSMPFRTAMSRAGLNA